MEIYQKFVVEGAWWDHVDEVAIRRIGPLLRAEPGPLRPIMLAWSTDQNLWRRRASIICQVGAKAATDQELLVDVLAANHADREFFIRKATGWALRDYARTDPDWVRGSRPRIGTSCPACPAARPRSTSEAGSSVVRPAQGGGAVFGEPVSPLRLGRRSPEFRRLP